MKRELLVKFDPRDVSRIFVQHPDGHFMEARPRSLGFPAISLREWKQARKALGVKGREERNDEQITKTALAQRKLIDEAIAKTAAADNPYRAWIDTYADAGFGDAVRAVIASTDQAGASASDTIRGRMATAFIRSCQYEWLFWDGAWQRRFWPVSP